MTKGAHNIFQDLGAKVLAIVVGKSEQRHTDETPVVQTAGAMPFHIIHQDTARRMNNRFLAWCDNQEVLNPRLVEQTSPKLRERAGHEQFVVPQFAEYKPPQFTPHNGIQRIDAPATPIPATPPAPPEPVYSTYAHDAQAENVQALSPALLPPGWLQDLRKNPPATCQQSAPVVPAVVPLPDFIGGDKPPELMTLRTSNSRPLPWMMGFSEPLNAGDLPTAPRKSEEFADFAEQEWITGNSLQLDPMASGEIAAVDKTASYIAPQAWDELETLAGNQPDDDTVEVPTVTRMKHTKESE